jgi:23S rRNA pseudouridine2605 synthase
MLERLQKIIARAGIASRRHAEELIRSGQVRVNGVVVTELGAKADPQRDRVEAAGRIAERPSEPTYFLLHKPVHVVSTMSDPEGRATLRHVLRGLSGGIFPVGRLDYAASGLMLLTSDGELADRIFKNSARLPQVYWLKVAGRLSDDEMQQIQRQAHARMRRLRAPGAAAFAPANPWYEVELSDARRDLLRRALFALGHPLEKMKRVKVGPLELGDLAEGRYRPMEPREVAQLRRYVEKPVEKPAFRKEREGPVSGLRGSPAKSSGIPGMRNPPDSKSRRWRTGQAKDAAPARPEKRAHRHKRRQGRKSRRPAQ